MEEDRPLTGVTPEVDSSIWKKDDVQIMALPPNDDTTFVPATEFLGAQAGSTADNPVNLSNAPTKSLNMGTRPQGTDADDKSKILGHFSDALGVMAQSIMDLEDSYFMALHEVIIETENALQDISRINSHYVSGVVTVMAGWQEAVQTVASHMKKADLTIYLVCHEDIQRGTREYVNEVIKACKE